MKWADPSVATHATAATAAVVPLNSAAQIAVSVEGVRKSFGETRALVNASIVARAGEIHAIVGENGSGKSTLAKVISGVMPPDDGIVNVLGIMPKLPAEAIAAGVATIYQEILIADSLTVKENLSVGQDGFWSRRPGDAERQRLYRDTLNRLVGSDVDPSAIAGTLPLSVKQWIVIARALVANPKVLIFDESSAALDLDATRRLHDEMRRLKSKGCCILLVTHRIAELVQIADVATVLRDGVTVGRLERSEIAEDRLLELMSAATVHSSSSRPRVEFSTHAAVLSAQQVVVQKSTAPINFELRAGEIVGLAGLDGAGQSEFIRVLAGIDPVKTGTVIGGRDRKKISGLAGAMDQAITYVSGDRKKEGLFPKLSIVENFGMALMRQVHSPLLNFGDRHQRFLAEKGKLSIKFRDERDPITTLSGGNQQKVLIARAFALKPSVILLNDPARGVDVGTKQDLYVHLRQFADGGGAVVYLSSEIEEFFGFAHRVDVFFRGSVFKSLSGDDVNEHRILAAMFGRRGSADFDVGEAAAQ